MHRVVALVAAPQASFELGCAAAVFRDPPYRFGVCTEEPGNVRSTEGFDMVVTSGLRALSRADTIVIPGWLPINREPSDAVVRALLRAHRRGARLVSICSGAYLLAATGLLDGRRAATHWRYADELQRRFPAVQVDPDVLYIDHGDVATSGGSGTGIDLCLHLVRRDQGASYASWVARRMVMPPHREGGQSQYRSEGASLLDRGIDEPPTRRGGSSSAGAESLGAALDWAVARLDEPITVEDLAKRVNVSPRTLARRFEQQLGTAPGQWLIAQRIARTRVLLEETDLSVEAIATRVGLSSATNLRRRFRAALHTTPTAYRRTYQGK
ncbi:helix-turn-helix domain-containing protein [Kribbella sp. NPDC048915]|uniref:helix-turn-helix domain-containing protein n=1 Tax=Kribbella sp. NPDC048915 TaxID=3155148 RepID=UPI0033C4185D